MGSFSHAVVEERIIFISEIVPLVLINWKYKK